MSVQITDNTSQIKADIAQKASIFLRLMADEMVDISTPVTPKLTGRLRMDIVKQVLGLHGKVVWGKNYAAIREKVEARKYTTPGTHAHYAEGAAKQLPDRTGKIAKASGLI